MARAFRKDTLRTIANSKKRFISILVICALGVTMVCGLRASCVDLRNSAEVHSSPSKGYHDAVCAVDVGAYQKKTFQPSAPLTMLQTQKARGRKPRTRRWGESGQAWA